MKNLNIKIKTITRAMILSGLFATVSCQDVLETSPKGILSEDQLTTGASVETLIVAAYQGLGAHFFGNGEAFLGPTSNWVNEVRSDNAYKGGGGTQDLSEAYQLETNTLDPTNGIAFNKWRNLMFGISRTNFAIRQLGKVQDADYPVTTRLAEMRMLRGHFHFDLKRNYDEIPYLDENADVTKVSNKQFTSDELWQKIEADFQFAYENLPETQSQIGRVNKYNAAAYLAKIALETKQWAKAIQYADVVINAGKYRLLDNFEDNSKVAFENGPEAVFTVQFSTENNYASHNWGDLLNVTRSPGIASGGYANGDDFYLGSQNLVNAFRTDVNGLPLFDSFDNVDVLDGDYSGSLDPRVDHTVGRLGIPWKGTAIYTEAWVRDPAYMPGFSGKKNIEAPNAPGMNQTFPWAATGLNYVLIRYSEVLLWKAEALIESNQDLDEARSLINQVRDRARTGSYVKTLDGSSDAANYLVGIYPSSGWSQDYARKALRFERRLELAMEGHRIYDLNRWGIAAQTMNAYYQSEGTTATYLAGKVFVAGKHEYLPIPQSEIDLAPTVYFQRDAYK
ncbi:RagB/SusD family nutrient uptake outer membrane protein [Parachryseolinea silvisoli]|uniref:RagB/SusD family nutrient uptake outer membrane protein n=1 Tax=Parachryseolinea silvisoli TaxID=2873601 RepID=UPI002265CEDA|nr:RagB/SusD family nutrient uptake outer membrane protein [Parachryseolinea silvisoli]MCD9017151.1 RagB/SusD family nutrient uptake outer membrane protein [Parachryseolinea silvisoli]